MKNNRPKTLPATVRLYVVAAMSLLSVSGCQYLGPFGQKAPMPEIMKIRPVKAEKPKPPYAPEKIEISKEFYPPTGSLIGSTSLGIGTKSTKEGKYTLNFDDADLAEVAKVILGDTLKLNYVINPKVAGKVSLQTAKPLADDEMIPTLEMLLQMNGAVLIKSGSLYKIEPEASATIDAPGVRVGMGAMEPGYQIRVVPVRYVNVQELQKAIEPLMPPKSVVRADEARNLLMLAGTADELETVMETVRLFDVDYMRGMSVGFFPVKNVDVATIAEEVDKLLGSGGKGPMAGMLKIIPVERLNAIMVVTPQAGYLDDVETWIERLDRYATTKSSNLHVYRVQNVDAADLANTIGQIFGQGGGRGGSRGASVAPGMSGSSVGSGSSFGSGNTNSAVPGSGSGSSSGFGSSGLNNNNNSGMGSGSGFYENSAYAFGDTSGTSSSGGLGGSSSGGMGSSSGFGGSSSGGMGGSSSGGSSGSSGGGRGGSRGATATELGNNTRIIADPSNNALIILAKAQDYKEIEGVIKELDIMPLQVLIDATIVEVTLSDNLKYGLKWYFEHGKGAAVLDTPTSALISSAAGGFTYSLVNHAKDIRIELDALADTSKVNVLSTPSVMVLNNQEAQINVGRRVPTPTSSLSNFSNTTSGILTGTNTGGTLSANLQYQESGVTLRVRPRVNAGGLVILDIAQQSSDPKSVKVGGVDTYEFQQRKINSVVAVPNGETLALGGLIQDTRTDPSISGIPILSRIPYIGPLFGTWIFAETKTELLMLITPRVVEGRSDVARITNEFRRRMKSYHFTDPISVETLPADSGTRPLTP